MPPLITTASNSVLNTLRNGVLTTYNTLQKLYNYITNSFYNRSQSDSRYDRKTDNISGSRIVPYSITSTKIGNNEVRVGNIGTGAVIGANNIIPRTATKISANSIGHEDVGLRQIQNKHLAPDLDASKITAGVLSKDRLPDITGAVPVETNLPPSSISGDIAAGTIRGEINPAPRSATDLNGTPFKGNIALRTILGGTDGNIGLRTITGGSNGNITPRTITPNELNLNTEKLLLNNVQYLHLHQSPTPNLNRGWGIQITWTLSVGDTAIFEFFIGIRTSVWTGSLVAVGTSTNNVNATTFSIRDQSTTSTQTSSTTVLSTSDDNMDDGPRLFWFRPLTSDSISAISSVRISHSATNINVETLTPLYTT